jgi:Lrp/AsnC family transcriptional regulator, leucine-responsive regulatory protein
MAVDVDEIDRALLRALQRDARIPQAALGARVGLSAAAVNRRLRRLTDRGVIAGSTVVLDPAALGHPVTVIAHVALISEHALLDRARSSFTSCPQVQQCYYVAGEWDFVLVLCVADMSEYTELTRELFFADDNVRRFSTEVVMDRAKTTLDVPLQQSR